MYFVVAEIRNLIRFWLKIQNNIIEVKPISKSIKNISKWVRKKYRNEMVFNNRKVFQFRDLPTPDFLNLKIQIKIKPSKVPIVGA